MDLPTKSMLAQLGAGATIDSVCQQAGLSRDAFQQWWAREIAARVPASAGTRRLGVRQDVQIVRDAAGIPHISAKSDEDLFFGFGYATAQDRLFQLDYLRRRATGRLAEVLGPEGLDADLVARTVGLPRIAQAEWSSLPAETRTLLEGYARGINAFMDESRDCLAIEFDLLGYQPEPWTPQDSLAIEGEFRWYLTGRFPVIVIPELARRVLGDGPLYKAFLRAEADGEAILPEGSYPAVRCGSQPVGMCVGDPQEGLGSNNWVVSGDKSVSGKPLVASDPHIAFAAVSCWHEVHLCGGSFDVAGTTYAGMPAVMFGRNKRVAWGCTNNICSLRDLYQEQTDAAHPDCFLFDGKWERARAIEEVIQVKGREAVRKTIRYSRNGPIVNDILPPQAHGTGVVALKWQGAYPCGWLSALLGMNRAGSAAEFREATRGWIVPTFCLVYGDVEGHIGYQSTGRIPIRKSWERGYRPGWDPAHQWEGLIPFEGMPHVADPPRGWMATANNRVATNDYPYPLFGTWSSGHRMQRIRQMLEAQPRFSREDFVRMQRDAVSLRAAENVPVILKALAGQTDPRIRAAMHFLATWDFRMETDRVAATIFNVFFLQWSRAVAEARFDHATAQFLAGAVGGLSASLLIADDVGWFRSETRADALVRVFRGTLDLLTSQFGPDMLDWCWGRMHTIQQKHVLTTRGDLGTLLDRGNVPVSGDGVTVSNTGADPNWVAPMGAGYRMIADLADNVLWAVDAGAESGNPGSPHYDDQLSDWLLGQYHALAVDGSTVRGNVLTLEPE